MHFFRTVLWLISLLSFVACGGGSGGGSNSSNSLVYDGKTTKAVLTKDKAKEFVSSAKNISLESVSSDVSDSNKMSKSLLKQGKVTQGAKSGTVDFTRTTINKLTTKIVATFKNFSDDGLETLNGKVIYLITVDIEETSFIKKMDMSISLLTIKSKNTDITLDGSIIVIADDDGRNETFTQNTVVKNNSNDEVLKFENFITVVDDNGRDLSYAGKIFHNTHGYVVISTPVELSYTDADTVPSMGGVISYEGKNSIVHERIAYDGRIRVEIDEGKDGTVDEFEVYDIRTLEVVANTAPITTITFPKEIFTNTNSSEIKIVTYDPDLDEFTNSFEWQVNGEVKSTILALSTELFKKHDTLKLIVTSEDNRVGDKKSSIINKEQKVLNSRPVITSSFKKISLTLGETEALEYSIEDADNDDLQIIWEHTYGFDDETIEEYLTFSNFECTHAIQEYDTEHDISYASLSTREQEDVRNAICSVEFSTQLSHDFVNNNTFSAIAIGFFKHKMIVSDGDYNRTRRLASQISQMNLIESQESNHVDYSNTDVHSVYMEDMNNDGKKDLIHITGLYAFSDEEPVFVIEYRDGKTLLEKVEYNLPNLTRYDLNDYYIKDLNGDGKLDVLFIYFGEHTQDHTLYGKMLQKDDGAFESIERFSLENRDSLVVDNILGDKAEEIIIVEADDYGRKNKVKIYSKDSNLTLDTSLPTSIDHFGLGTQIVTYDLDNNSKKDIIIINENYLDGSELNFECSVLSQEINGSFSEKIYTTRLEDNLPLYKHVIIQNIKIVDIDDNKDIWIVQSSEKIYFIKLEDNELIIINSVIYDSDASADGIEIFDPVDINNDGKTDLVFGLKGVYDDTLHVFIQKENLEFLSVQKYDFINFTTEKSSVLGDIDNDGQQELFISTGEEELSVLYFK